MQTIEYKVKVSPDTTGLKEAVKKADGEFKRLDDHTVVVKLDYDGNYKKFYEKIKEINDKVPELGVKFQYDLNKKALEAAKNDLKNLEGDLDPKISFDKVLNEYKRFSDAVKKNNIKGDLSKIDTNDALRNEISKNKELRDFRKSYAKAFQNLERTAPDKMGELEKVNKDAYNLGYSLPEYNSTIRLTTEKKVKEQRKLVEEIESNVNRLKVSVDSANAQGISVDVDTAQADSKLGELKKDIDSIEDEKKVHISVETDTEKLKEAVSEWDTASKKNFAVASSKSGIISTGEVDKDRSSISTDSFKELSEGSTEPIDTWIRSHTENVAAFAKDEIKQAFEAFDDGIKKQIVATANEMMQLDVDKIDSSRRAEIINEIETRFKEIDETFEQKAGESLKDNIEEVRQAFISSISGLDDTSKNELLKSFDADFKKVSEGIDFNQSIYDISEEFSRYVDDIVDDYTSKLKDSKTVESINSEDVSNKFYEGIEAFKDKFADEVQKEYQSVLTQIFTDTKNLKPGETSAISISPLSTAPIATEKPKTSEAVGVPIEPANVAEFRGEIQKQLDALDPIEVKVEQKSLDKEETKSEDTTAPISIEVDNDKDFIADVENIISQAKKVVEKNSPLTIKVVPEISKEAIKDVVEKVSAKVEEQAKKAATKGVIKGTLTNVQNTVNKAIKGDAQTQTKVKKKKYDKKSIQYAKDELEAYNKLVSGTGKLPSSTDKSYSKQWDELIKSRENLLKSVNTSGEKAQLKSTVGSYVDSFIAKLNEAKKKVDDLNSKPIDLTDPKTIADLESLQSELDKILNVDSKLSDNKLGNMTKLASLKEEISGVMGRYSGMSKDLKNKYSSVLNQIGSMMDNPSSTSAKAVQDMTLKVKELGAEFKASGQDVKGFWGIVGERVTSVNAQFIAQYLSFQDFIRYARIAADTVIQLNSALTELRKVSDASDFRLDQSFKKSAETGKELGATIKDVINLTADWSRLGYNVDEAEQLARITTLFKNVGDGLSTDEASSYMISTLKGFELPTEYAERMVDVYNELGNNYAISSGEVGEALQRSAASLNAANTSFEQSAALVTATNAVVQDPKAVGNMWKTNKLSLYTEMCA